MYSSQGLYTEKVLANVLLTTNHAGLAQYITPGYYIIHIGQIHSILFVIP